jgi:hypothetical protein
LLIKSRKNLLVVAGLLLAAHQIALVPHALCQSIEAMTGDPVELVAADEERPCEPEAGIAPKHDDHGHDHCEHKLPDSRQSQVELSLDVTVTSMALVFGTAPAVPPFLVTTIRNVASSDSTDQFTRHVRILS